MAQSLTQQQVQAAMDAFVATPAFLALPEGKDRANAYNTAFNALTNGDIPTAGSGLFQSIPGQSDLESALTRAAGIATGAVVGGALVAGAGAPAASGTAATAPAAASSAAPAAASTIGSTIAKNSSWLAPLFGGAAAVAGSLINANATKSAAQTQAQTAQQALGVATGQFNLQQQELAPYRNIGVGALNQLNAGLGTGAPTANAAAPSPQVDPNTGLVTPSAPTNLAGVAPTAPTAPTQSAPALPAVPTPPGVTPMSSGVRIRLSNGQTGTVPPALLQTYIAQGAQVLGNNG